MFKNYFRVAWRNLLRNPKISVINIGGLAIGLACVIILYLYTGGEFGYDAYYKSAGRIYRIYTHISLDGAESNSAKSSPPAGAALRMHFPEVEANTLIGYEAAYNMRYNDKTFREHSVYTADSNYFKVFDHKLLKGNPATALSMPRQLVLTESAAKRYFGDADPVGRQLVVDDTASFIVSAVMADFPVNSHFNADMFISMETLHGRDDQNWLALAYSNFVLLKKGADAKALEQKLNSIVDKGAAPQIEKMLSVPYSSFRAGGNAFEMKLQPLTNIYLYSKERYGIDPNTEWGDSRVGNILYVRIFIATALLVLLIAVFNFMNIATARSEKKARETGIRKTLGSGRWQLMLQYFTEAIITTAIAVVVALCLVKAGLPWFNQLTGKTTTLNLLGSAWTIPLLVVFTILVGVLAGSYPAIFLSAFRPVETLKGMQHKSKTSLRSVLVVSQFAISIALIIGVIAVKKQLDYMQNKNLGIRPQQLITITNGASLGNKLQPFRQELLKNPAIASVTNSSLMFAAGVPESAYTYENKANANPVHAAYLDVDEYFVPTFGIGIKEGRFFNAAMPTDSNAVVINEPAARNFAPDAKSVIGHTITMLSNDSVPRAYRIIGVIKNFNFESLHQMIKPLVLHFDKVQQAATYITVKYTGNDVASVRSYVERTWNGMDSFDKCNFNLLDDTINSLYSNERRIKSLAILLSVLGVLVACFGLLGLAMFITEQRKKEIGIRKVLGATVAEVVATVSKQFVFWILLANLLAWPAAYFVLNNWLQNFAYHIRPAWWMFGGAGAFTLLIALVTISTQSVKAAIANPVKSLRTE